jgi:hypothetical protein
MEDIKRSNTLPGKVAELYNRYFGVPVIMVNKSGPWSSPVPNRILPMAEEYSFSGRSRIIDSDGKLLAELDEAEDLAMAEITLEPALKKSTKPEKYSRYIYDGSPGREILRLVEAMGALSYTLSRERKHKALVIEEGA